MKYTDLLNLTEKQVRSRLKVYTWDLEYINLRYDEGKKSKSIRVTKDKIKFLKEHYAELLI